VVFVTLEDESGCVNVVVWRDLLERQRRELLGARLLGVAGVLEREGLVVHLIARRLEDHSALLGRLEVPSGEPGDFVASREPGDFVASRDFH
jgi:error-prone DNA polymerase